MFRLPKEARVTAQGRITAPHELIRTFSHHCRHCGWHGPGAQPETDSAHGRSSIVDYDCPNGHEWIAFGW
jgi:predicted RNA-binding Zn-ribbon protein involved in translation (DUF1610 family)